MKRLCTTRRLVGVVILAGFITLWARSFRHVDGVQLFDGNGYLHGVASDRGTILLFTSKIPFGHDKAWTADPFSVSERDFRQFDGSLYDQTALKFKCAGFKVSSDKYDLTDNALQRATVVATWPYQAVTIPDWFLAGIFAIPTLRALRGAWVRRRRKAHGLCAACGYDLRGAPRKCPECGRESLRPRKAHA